MQTCESKPKYNKAFIAQCSRRTLWFCGIWTGLGKVFFMYQLKPLKIVDFGSVMHDFFYHDSDYTELRDKDNVVYSGLSCKQKQLRPG